MIQIVFIDNGVKIAGIDYPNNHLVFGIERTNCIEIYNSGNKVISAPYTEFINERSEPFLSPQAVITALELTYVMGASQNDLDIEIAARIAGDSALSNRTSILENNEYKITYFEIVTGTSGSLTMPTGATINEGEFGPSGNAILSKIDGSNKPTIESPKDISGNVVTVSLATDGSWITSAAYTDISVAIIYSIRIKAIDYPNLNYDNIFGEPEDIGTISEYYRGDRTFQTLNTAAVAESLSYLYFTTTRVLATVLTGLNTGLTGVITSSDTILQAFGKLQYQISNMSLSAYLEKAQNLADLVSISTARVNLGLDKQTNGGNAAYSILATDKTVYTGTAFTTARIWTLPNASTVNPGYEIIVADYLGTVTSTNTLTIGVQVGQKLNNTVNGTEIMQSAGGWRRFISDGVSNWTFDAGIVRQSKTQTLSNKTLDSTNVGVTQTAGDNSTKIATTAYVDAASPPTVKLFNYYNFS